MISNNIKPTKSHKTKDVELSSALRWDGKTEPHHGANALIRLRQFNLQCQNACVSAKVQVQLLLVIGQIVEINDQDPDDIGMWKTPLMLTIWFIEQGLVW